MVRVPVRHLVTYPNKRDIGGGGSEEEFEFRGNGRHLQILSQLRHLTPFLSNLTCHESMLLKRQHP